VTLTQKIFISLTILATVILVSGYASKGSWSWGLLVMICGIIWLFGQNFGWDRINTTMLVIFMAAATRGIFLDIPAGWLLVSVTATLSAWDLHQFMSRLKQAGRVEKRTELERLHLKRIMSVAGLGIVLGAIALAVELKLSFGWMLFFGIILFLCLNRIFDLLGKEDKGTKGLLKKTGE